MHHASRAYAATAREIASPRELEANLLLQAAAKLQAVRDSCRISRSASRRRCCSTGSSGRYSSAP